MWNLKRNYTNELNLRNRNRFTDLENKHVYHREGWGDGIVREFGMGTYTLLCLKWITNKDLCIAQGTLLNIMWQPGWEGSLGENEYMYMYG